MVYAVSDPRGFIKIGKATDPYKRLKQLQVGNPYRLTILKEFHPVGEMSDLALEKKLHDYFLKFKASDLRDGYTEWYRAEILDEIVNFDISASQYAIKLTRHEIGTEYLTRLKPTEPTELTQYGQLKTLLGTAYKDTKTELIRKLQMYESFYMTPNDIQLVLSCIPEKTLDHIRQYKKLP